MATKADQERVRLEKMKFYATYIRKVDEDDILKKRHLKSVSPTQLPQPGHVQKYRKFMQLLEENGDTMPRVSELSRRIEDDK